MIDDLFADLLKFHSIKDIYEMDILEFLRLKNRKKTTKKKSRKKVDSFFDLF